MNKDNSILQRVFIKHQIKNFLNEKTTILNYQFYF